MTADQPKITTTRRGSADTATYTILRDGEPTGFTATRNGNEPARSSMAWVLAYSGTDVDEFGSLADCKREAQARLAGQRPLNLNML
jgi:hypothetical protein